MSQQFAFSYFQIAHHPLAAALARLPPPAAAHLALESLWHKFAKFSHYDRNDSLRTFGGLNAPQVDLREQILYSRERE